MNYKVVSTNRKVYRDYQIIETYEAGVVLRGGEVKSLRLSNVSLQDSFCKIVNNEILLYNMHIAQYEKSSFFKTQPRRTRKLLLHKKEISRLYGRLTQRNLALIPLELYFNHSGIAKLKIGLAKKLKGPDKRELIKQRDLEKELRRTKLY